MSRRRRRPVTAHDIKRRLIAKFNALHRRDRDQVDRIVTELREYAVARKFHHGSEVDALVRDEELAERWDRLRVEACIRRRTHLIGVRR